MAASAKAKQGFSLVDMMAAMVAFGILAVSVGLMLVYGWRSWRYSVEAVALQRDASLAQQVIEREIRTSSAAHISITPNTGIDFTVGGVRTNYSEYIVHRGNSLFYGRPEGEVALMEGGVVGFSPELLTDEVQVVLRYQSASGRGVVSSVFTVFTRN